MPATQSSEVTVTTHVEAALATLYNVSVEWRAGVKCPGGAKVEFAEPWPAEGLRLLVCDGQGNRREVLVFTARRASLVRILRTRLTKSGVKVIGEAQPGWMRRA